MKATPPPGLKAREKNYLTNLINRCWCSAKAHRISCTTITVRIVPTAIPITISMIFMIPVDFS
jgi:hypothetical protein